MDLDVNPGNAHNSVAFDPLYDRAFEEHPEVRVIVGDAAFKTPWIAKKILDDK